MMITVVALLLIITMIHVDCHEQCNERYMQVPVDCGGHTNMNRHLRREAVYHHNFKRFYLADGTVFYEQRGTKFPTASDMNALYYDCDLENAAHEIARQCHNGGPDFDYVGSNNDTSHHLPSKLPADFVEMIVNKWWDTVRKDGTLVDLTPSEENRAMIPFLQMANGGTNKLGCAYHLCNDADGSVDAYILFVCTYGDPHIKVGSPIYTEGLPCDSCKDRCLHGALCDTEIA